MFKRFSAGPLLAVLGFMTACSEGAEERGGSPDPSAPSSSTPDGLCSDGRNLICEPEGLPFATFALGVGESCLEFDEPCAGATTVQLRQPEAGKVCLAGSVAAGGWNSLIVGFSVVDAEIGQVLRKFDAQALGITQVAFTIDSPPSGGVSVDGSVNTVLSCPEDAFDCMTYGFNLMDGPNSSSPLNITAPGRITAPFTHFKQVRPPPVSQAFDTSAIEHFAFANGPGAYDFCVSDLQFLDAAGRVVEPE